MWGEQVAALQAGIRDQKARSALELMGRKQLSPADLQAGLGEAEAAARILQVLLDVPDDMQRLALLPEAFAPASEEHLAAGVRRQNVGGHAALHDAMWLCTACHALSNLV